MRTYVMEKKKDSIFTPEAFTAEMNAAKAATARTMDVVHTGRPVYSGLESVMVAEELASSPHCTARTCPSRKTGDEPLLRSACGAGPSLSPSRSGGHGPTHVFSKESPLLFQRAASVAPRHPLCSIDALASVRGKLGSALWVGDPGPAPYSAPDSLLNTDQDATHLKTPRGDG